MITIISNLLINDLEQTTSLVLNLEARVLIAINTNTTQTYKLLSIYNTTTPHHLAHPLKTLGHSPSPNPHHFSQSTSTTTHKLKPPSSSSHFLSSPLTQEAKISSPFLLVAAAGSKGEARDFSLAVMILEDLELGARRVVELGGRDRDL